MSEPAKRLAVLKRDQLGEPLGVAHRQVVGLAQDLTALARLLFGPALECGVGGVDRGLASSTVELATDAILFSVAGSITSKRPLSDAFFHLPPI